MEEHHLANHVADMSAGVSIVADIGNAVWREGFRADSQNAIAHRIRHPGIDAVRDDVVERSAARSELHQIEVLKPDIVQRKIADHLLAFSDGTTSGIDPDKLTPRKL